MATDLQKENRKFIKKYTKLIIYGTFGTTLFPSVKMAQSCLESYYGRATIKNAKNLFGIKAAGEHTPYWKGAAVNADTKEEYNGVIKPQKSDFRKYKSFADSVKDHTYFLKQYARYKPVFEAKTPEDQARALQKAGYATNSEYASKLINIINTYDLKKLDKKKETMKTVRIIVASLIILAVGYYIYTVIKY